MNKVLERKGVPAVGDLEAMNECKQDRCIRNPLTNLIPSTDSSPNPMIFRTISEGRLAMLTSLVLNGNDIDRREGKDLKKTEKGRKMKK